MLGEVNLTSPSLYWSPLFNNTSIFNRNDDELGSIRQLQAPVILCPINLFPDPEVPRGMVHTEVSTQHSALSRTLLVVIMERDKGKKKHLVKLRMPLPHRILCQYC